MSAPTTESRDEQALEREKQVKQAEELLFAGPQRLGVAKGLFWGRFVADWVFPYPTLGDERPKVEAALAELRGFCDAHLDPVAIDRQADIPRAVIDGLGRLGVLGMTAPEAMGGRGFSQGAYCKILEELGSRCSSTSIFVNAHHSIGMRALLLFGTDEQKRRWLPGLIRGEALAAFALTEPEAGSDAANVQTTATPSGDGSHYVLNGQKRYITNGGIADVLTVMARTPVPGREGTAVTAFLVTPDIPGFRVVEARAAKLGIRGTATGKLAFEDMAVARENVLGTLGKGLRLALTVLDFGRTTFGACCTGASKSCLRLAIEHARTRRQFGRTLGAFELVRSKVARMAAWTYAMEAMTTVTAGLIDRGLDDYMLETAMLKVYSTEALWTIVNDAFQIHGGAAYFTDRPLERMFRDARINQIGEGANEVLTSFIAMVGLRGPGEHLRDVYEAVVKHRRLGLVPRFLGQQAAARFRSPAVPVRSSALRPHARELARLIRRFALAVQRAMMRHREEILERQLVHARIAWAAMELYAMACVLSRRDAELSGALPPDPEPALRGDAAALALQMSARRIREELRDLDHNDDPRFLAAARASIDKR
ncbi:acyl-CoA dehydrogenase family protein [Tautonia plasticadhaerens]|uniref:Putative acyl-CoA dehydrogenase n=1 Tax=Tautonia plasticadhaerens TaxID=2527974 RepID=A0A518HES8_9BACT|nr:acyl-CoA dehydrogenase family protein [Tautonia plasticadhaerens]QDV39355.1 putative acyl-CoA dehydrogenase [Tautonia plasticadhaerens]